MSDNDTDDDIYGYKSKAPVETPSAIVYVNPNSRQEVQRKLGEDLERQRLEKQKQLDELRQQLIAKRKMQKPLLRTVGVPSNTQDEPYTPLKRPELERSNSIDLLLAEGQAAAAAKQEEGEIREQDDKPAPSKPNGDVDVNPPIQAPAPTDKPLVMDPDIAYWLEISGYHNTEYREQRLKTYRMRAALEAKQKQLDAEKAELERMLAAESTPMPFPSTSAASAAPVAAVVSPAESIAKKRPRDSPPPSRDTFVRRGPPAWHKENGAREPYARRPFDDRRPSSSYERRPDWAPYPDRPPSYEDRQGPPPDRFAIHGGGEHRLHAENPGHFGGGTHYFLMKSWNVENVQAAQRDKVWATQKRHTEMLIDAFHNCKEVILFFSANKSMAFQGAAVMTSPPDPSLPLPSFCQKLRWQTSPTFRIRWLTTAPVPFRAVTHIRNSYVRDDNGFPKPVLIGRDGQEVEGSAGSKLLEMLRNAENKGAGSGPGSSHGPDVQQYPPRGYVM